MECQGKLWLSVKAAAILAQPERVGDCIISVRWLLIFAVILFSALRGTHQKNGTVMADRNWSSTPYLVEHSIVYLEIFCNKVIEGFVLKFFNTF